MMRTERDRGEWARPVLSAFASAAGAAALSFAMTAPAQAQSNACVTDAELDAAVGDQVRSGSFTIDTSKLREAPMCSGITVAQAIQNLAGTGSSRPPSTPSTPPARAEVPEWQSYQTPSAQTASSAGAAGTSSRTAAAPATLEWLLGTWVMEGQRCNDGATVYLPGGRMASTTDKDTFYILGEYNLRGKVLTSRVFSERYDLTNVEWISKAGEDYLVSDIPNSTDPDLYIPDSRRCPEKAGVEPWFPSEPFKGMSTYRLTK